MGSGKRARASSSQNMNMSISGKLLPHPLPALSFTISTSSFYFFKKIQLEMNFYEFWVDLFFFFVCVEYLCKQIHNPLKEDFSAFECFRTFYFGFLGRIR
jgi:hypothetical protein